MKIKPKKDARRVKRDQREARERLNRAAPDLLEACMLVGAGLCLDQNVDELKAILSAAIAKAKGDR